MFSFFKKKDKTPYLFSSPERTPCFTCDHVLNGERPFLFASHDMEGDWQFLCGQDDHTAANGKLISLKQATELDPSLNELHAMPMGYAAVRGAVLEKWNTFSREDAS